MSLVVAFFHPHNEGLVAGIITGPGFNSGLELVDTHEVDATIQSFETEAEAEGWLDDQRTEINVTLSLKPVTGGRMAVETY